MDVAQGPCGGVAIAMYKRKALPSAFASCDACNMSAPVEGFADAPFWGWYAEIARNQRL